MRLLRPIRNVHKGLCFLASGLLFAGPLQAQDDAGVYSRRPAGTAKAREQYQANLKAHKANPEILVLPGLVADRTHRTVEVLAEATGLTEGEPVEFLLVDQGSSHGYESLFWSFAKPSDVHRALEFIGLKTGPPRNLALQGLGSDGDRVKLSVRKEGGAMVPAERLILDKETEKTLPEDGFVFAGSMMAAPADGAVDPRYVADVYDPRAVAPLYSELTAVLDIPRQVDKGEAYGRQAVNPDFLFEKGALVPIFMSPGASDGRRDPRRLGLSVQAVAGSTGVIFRLTGTNGVLSQASAITPPLERLAELRKDDGVPPVAELSFGDTLPLAAIVKTCGILAVMEALGGVRINPPAAGQPYYRAFLPEKMWVLPEGRPTQPWELHLRTRGGKVTGELVWNEPVAGDDGETKRFNRKVVDAPSPERLRAALDADTRERTDSGRPQLPAVLLVFADPDLAYGQLMRFLAPVMGTHGTVYVFLGGEGATRKAE